MRYMTMTTAILRRTIVIAAAGLALAGAGCSDEVREGRSPSYLIINKIEATQGNDTTLTGQLSSDVLTKGTVYEDRGFATMTLGLKNVGPEGTTSGRRLLASVPSQARKPEPRRGEARKR